MNFDEIARVAHQVNSLYCQARGEPWPSHWEGLDEHAKASVLDGVHFLAENPEAGPEACHENWIARRRGAGWKRGDVKDPAAKTHPAMVAWAFLPESVRMKDYLFWAVVRGLLSAIPAQAPNR